MYAKESTLWAIFKNANPFRYYHQQYKDTNNKWGYQIITPLFFGIHD